MVKRAPDFKWIYANTLGFTFTENEGRLIFSMAEEPGKIETAYEQVGVVMTPRTLKILGVFVSRTLAHYEETTGNVIPTDEEALSTFEASLDEAISGGPAT